MINVFKEGKLREFDTNDWSGYSGCEEFPDGSQPLITETDLFTTIVSYDSDEGSVVVNVMAMSDDMNQDFELTKSFGSKENAIRFAEKLSDQLCEFVSSEEEDIDKIAKMYKMDRLM